MTSCEPDNVGFRTEDEVMSIHNLGKVFVEPESASCGNKSVKFCSWVSLKKVFNWVHSFGYYELVLFYM